MANIRSSNVYYVDTAYAASIASTTELIIANLKVMYVTVTATSANARLELSDGSSQKLDLRVTTSGDTQQFHFDKAPILFASSLRPSVLTNAIASVVFEESRR